MNLTRNLQKAGWKGEDKENYCRAQKEWEEGSNQRT